MAYAYLDRYCILHVVEAEDTAKISARWNGKVEETDIKNSVGYPCAPDGDKLIVELIDGDINQAKAYKGGNEKNGKKANFEDYPAAYELAKKLL